MNIEGKVALITGAGHVKGIGYAIVRQLLGKRVKGVGILDINDENGREVLDILQNEFGEHRVIYVNCDVTSKTDLEGAFEKVKTHFGRLDIVCNNAGIQNEVNWELTLNINLMGTIRGTYLALEHMGVNYGGRGGIVINTASIAGIMTTSHFPVYGASKHGIVAFTRNTASNRTFKENKIRVSAFCPAKVDTPIQD
uniref:15-hydroxyprostaglandin dehydrogenase [NAD(+)] n=1 Tax=Saccoglossus kowalevskii TaxID=10224 RepID=A0ABM0MP93_SACKO